MLPHAFHKRARPRAYERERRTPTPARINARARTRAGDCAGDADLLLALRDAAVRHNRWQPGPQPAETAARCPFSLLLRRTPGRAADGRPLWRRRGGGGAHICCKRLVFVVAGGTYVVAGLVHRLSGHALRLLAASGLLPASGKGLLA